MDVVPGAWAPWPDAEGRVGTLNRCHVVAPSGLSGVGLLYRGAGCFVGEPLGQGAHSGAVRKLSEVA